MDQLTENWPRVSENITIYVDGRHFSCVERSPLTKSDCSVAKQKLSASKLSDKNAENINKHSGARL